MSPRKSEENIIIKLCKSLEGVCEGNSLVKILLPCHFNIFGINPRCLRKMPIKKNNEQTRLLKRLLFLLFCFVIKTGYLKFIISFVSIIRGIVTNYCHQSWNFTYFFIFCSPLCIFKSLVLLPKQQQSLYPINFRILTYGLWLFFQEI